MLYKPTGITVYLSGGDASDFNRHAGKTVRVSKQPNSPYTFCVSPDDLIEAEAAAAIAVKAQVLEQCGIGARDVAVCGKEISLTVSTVHSASTILRKLRGKMQVRMESAGTNDYRITAVSP